MLPANQEMFMKAGGAKSPIEQRHTRGEEEEEEEEEGGMDERTLVEHQALLKRVKELESILRPTNPSGVRFGKPNFTPTAPATAAPTTQAPPTTNREADLPMYQRTFNKVLLRMRDLYYGDEKE